MRTSSAACSLAALALLVGGTASAAQQADNLAFVDQSNTQAVVDAASSALATVLSYTYRELDANQRAAGEVGTEQYLQQHTDQLNRTKAMMTRQRLVMTTKVVGVGVRELSLESARLLVFLDQTNTRGDTNRTTTVGTAAMVELRKVGGQWRLDSVVGTAP